LGETFPKKKKKKKKKKNEMEHAPERTQRKRSHSMSMWTGTALYRRAPVTTRKKIKSGVNRGPVRVQVNEQQELPVGPGSRLTLNKGEGGAKETKIKREGNRQN